MSRPDFIKWASSPGGVYLGDKKKPTLATWQPYQKDILRHVLAAGDGRLPYSSILWSEPKKSGKSLLGAALHLYFALFVDTPSENYVLSNDLEGSADRVFKACYQSLKKAVEVPASGIKDSDFKQVGTQITMSNGSTIKALPADATGDAGGNQSFVTIDEVWGFSRPAAVALLTEFSPVPTRVNSTVFYTGYQGYANQDDLWWHQAIDGVMESGKPVKELEHIEDGDGKPACWSDGRTFLFYSHLPRHPWHTEEYLNERRHRMPLNEYLRVWENRRASNMEAFCTPEQWDSLLDVGTRSLHPGDTREIVLGVDAATKKDCTALVGTTWNPFTKKVELVFSQIWHASSGVIKLTKTIGPRIVELHQNYKVKAVYYDPYQMAAISEICQREGVKMEEFPQTSRRIESDTFLHDMIWGNNLAHFGDSELRQHVINAVAKSNSERGMRIVKEMTRKKIDGCVALGMSALGAVEKLAGGVTEAMKANENPFYD